MKMKSTNLKNEYEKINVKVNEAKNKEPQEEPLLAAMRKKTMESETAIQEEDDLKMKEMKERIQKYKDELRKGQEIDDLLMKGGKRDRLSYHVKHKDIIEQKLKDLIFKKIPNNENVDLLKNLNNKQDIIPDNKNNINTVEKEENKILKDIIDKKQFNTINNEKDLKKEKEVEKKDDKERDKSYSRAMDRFKKRYKKDNSVENRTKKSDKISEMAKRLENVIGKPNVSAEITNNNISNEIVHEKEQENKLEEIYESMPVVAKKAKKPQKFQFQ